MRSMILDQAKFLGWCSWPGLCGPDEIQFPFPTFPSPDRNELAMSRGLLSLRGEGPGTGGVAEIALGSTRSRTACRLEFPSNSFFACHHCHSAVRAQKAMASSERASRKAVRAPSRLILGRKPSLPPARRHPRRPRTLVRRSRPARRAMKGGRRRRKKFSSCQTKPAFGGVSILKEPVKRSWRDRAPMKIGKPVCQLGPALCSFRAALDESQGRTKTSCRKHRPFLAARTSR